MKRLLNREKDRYGEALNTNQEIKAKTKAFLEWAGKYDDINFQGRSIKLHRDWLELMDCEVVELNGDLTNEERLNVIIEKIKDAP